MGPGDWSLSLIHTKMSPPRLADRRVGRQALLGRLVEVSARPLTAIVAPAGFGKTTILSEWYASLREQGHTVAWLSLDDDDDDVQLLGRYVLAALSSHVEGVGRQACELLQRDPLTPIKTVQAVLLNEIAASGREVFLFLDDFERVSSRHSLAFIARLLRYAPPNFHMLIGTRRDPGLPSETLAAQERMLTLDATALRFTNDDAQAFFERAEGVMLDRSGVELLNAASEGWVTGLQLASLALRGVSDAPKLAREIAGQKLVADSYLYETVLSQMPAPVLQFVLRTSVLDRLCADVCDAIMGAGARSWEKIEWLEQNNMFIRALDEQRQWFRFHNLMSDVLRRRAQLQLGRELAVLHRRASQWLAAQGLWPEAVRHALAAGDNAQAALWAESCASALIDRSDVPTLLGWFSKLPADLVAKSLRLRLAKAWGLTLSFRIAEAARLVAELGEELADPSCHDEMRSDERADTLPAELAAVNAVIAGFSDDTPRSLELGLHVDQSATLAPKWARRFAQASQIFGLAYDGQFDEVRHIHAATPQALADGEPIYSSVYRESMVGLASLVEGRLREATAIFEKALLRAESAVGRDAAAVAVPSGYLVALYYERDDIAAAYRVMNGRTALALAACPLGSLLRFCRGAARVYARQGDLESALVVIEEAREVATERHWLRLRAGCDAEAVRLLLQAQRLPQAEQTLAELRGLMPAQHPQPAGSFVETWASYVVASARMSTVQGQPGEAVGQLTKLRTRLDATGMRYLSAAVSLQLALALQQIGQADAALEALEVALRYAGTEPMISSIVDEGAPMLDMLARLRRHPRTRDLPHVQAFDRLLAARGEYSAKLPLGPVGRGMSAGVLSAREVEILNHISKGLSNKEIARALRVAPETIKWHLKNIFEKLNVGSRIEAVQTGLGLGLSAAHRSEPAAAPPNESR